jgi:hypothetical protein
MPKIEITKHDLLSLLDLEDVPFATTVLLEIVDTLPTTYINNIIRMLYYTRIHEGDYCVLVKEDWFEMFATKEQVYDYFAKEYPLTDKSRVTRFVNGYLAALHGYQIKLFSNKNK